MTPRWIALTWLSITACGASAPPPAPVEAPAAVAADSCAGPDALRDEPSALLVYEYRVPWEEVRAAERLRGFDRYDEGRAEDLQLDELVTRGLLERELLVREGRRRGMSLEAPDAILARILRERVLFSNAPAAAPENYPHGAVAVRDAEITDREDLARYAEEGLGLTLDALLAWQAREALALRVRDALLADVEVDEAAIAELHARRSDAVEVTYLRFVPVLVAPDEVDPAAVSAWHDANRDAVVAEYERSRHRYVDLPPARRARHILVACDASAPEPERATARRRAQALLRRLRRGARFEELARESDDSTAARGGDLGWAPQGHLVDAVDDAVFGASQPGLLPAIVESQDGFHVVEVLGIRAAGDTPRAEAEREIAERLFRGAQAAIRARAEAEAALARWRAEGPPDPDALEARYGDEPSAPRLHLVRRNREAHPPRGDGEDGLSLSREQLVALTQQLRWYRHDSADRARPPDDVPEGVIAAAFEMEVGALPDAPLSVDGTFVVFQVTARHRPEDAPLDAATRDAIQRELLERARRERLPALVARLREQATEAGCVAVAPPPSAELGVDEDLDEDGLE